MKNKERLTTYHCGKAVIKDKNKLSEAMKKLAEFEEKKNVENGLMLSNLRKLLLHSKVRSGFQRVRDFPKMKAIYWYRLKTPQCRISRDMKKITRAVRSIREMMKNHIQAMVF